MSGVEVLGAISGAITIIEASIKLYKTAKESSGLPPQLCNAACRLPLIQDSLQRILHHLQHDCRSQDSRVALETVLHKCNDRAVQLHAIFTAMVPPPESSRTQRYFKAMRSLPRVEKASELVDEILADLQVLTLNQVIKSATRQKVSHSEDTGITETMDGEPVTVLHNFGCGTQYVQAGDGSQNIVVNRATQINGTFQGGTFNFTQA
ncbi:hypothetical protein SNK04_004530 [Fusarium graminearum]